MATFLDELVLIKIDNVVHEVKKSSAKNLTAIAAISEVIRLDIVDDTDIFPITTIEQLEEVEHKLKDRSFQLQVVSKIL